MGPRLDKSARFARRFGHFRGPEPTDRLRWFDISPATPFVGEYHCSFDICVETTMEQESVDDSMRSADAESRFVALLKIDLVCSTMLSQT